jgi:ATP-binding cassette subfamily G (WHITE) protein 2 (SNQ2)
MHPWFSWIFWIDPLSYAVEAIMGSQLENRAFNCVGPNLIPNGPQYQGQPSSCSGVQGSVGSTVNGANYLSSLSFSSSHVWRNFGIIWAFWAGFVFASKFNLCMLRVKIPCLLKSSRSAAGLLMMYGATSVANASTLEFARNKETLSDKALVGHGSDEEKQQSVDTNLDTANSTPRTGSVKEEKALIENKSIFTWKNLTYTVKTPEGDRVLLDQVNGYIKPGTLGALMGSSGAGKVGHPEA